MARALNAAILGAALLLSACATATPYQAATTSIFGFSETPIEANRFRVGFSGNSLTERSVVENYLLFRAAELTLKQGSDFFVVVDRKTDEKKRADVIGYDRGFDNFRFGIGYSFYSPRFGWRAPLYYRSFYNPFYDPFWYREPTIIESTRYVASAEITLYKGPKPADNPLAFDARDVVRTLGPTVKLPKTT